MAVRIHKRIVDKNIYRDGRSAHWSPKQRFEAVALYKVVGSLRIVSQTLGIPFDTIKVWKQKDWWREYEQEIIQEARTTRSKKLDRIINKSAELLEDRLENGDIYLGKDGEIRRKPINANTASKILTTTIDREVLLEKLQQESKQTESKETMDARLANLFQEFQKFAKSKTIEIDQHHAIHEEREEGLQSGVELGEHQKEIPVTGQGGTTQGESLDGESGESPQG